MAANKDAAAGERVDEDDEQEEDAGQTGQAEAATAARAASAAAEEQTSEASAVEDNELLCREEEPVTRCSTKSRRIYPAPSAKTKRMKAAAKEMPCC
jgi:hypothetical protein